jgi:hypothetical protein
VHEEFFMKAFTILTALIALVAGGVFADTKPAVQTATGAVESFTAADAAKTTPAVLVVKVAGKDESFVVDSKTTVVGKDKKAVDVATVKAGAAVVVQYTAADKALDAVSVSLQ